MFLSNLFCITTSWSWITLEQQFSKYALQTLWDSSEGLWSHHYFRSNSRKLFAFFIVVVFELMVQKQ